MEVRERRVRVRKAAHQILSALVEGGGERGGGKSHANSSAGGLLCLAPFSGIRLVGGLVPVGPCESLICSSSLKSLTSYACCRPACCCSAADAALLPSLYPGAGIGKTIFKADSNDDPDSFIVVRSLGAAIRISGISFR